MKVNKIVRYLVKDYGWSDTDKFTDMQLELIKDVADIVSNRLEQLVMPKIADTDWMPVEDLPDDNSGYYLCYTKYIYNDDKPQYFYETARIEDRQWYAPNGENITDNVIYWKELPKAPH